MELDNLTKKNYTYENEGQENIRSYSHDLIKKNDSKNKRKSKKIFFDRNSTQRPTFIDKELISEDKEEYDDKIKEMPFLILPLKVLNFHQQNEGKFIFKIIIFSLVLFITSFSCAQYIYVSIFCTINEETDERKEILEKLSFQKVITNFSLNLIYTIDIDLVVFMINWGFFTIYSNGLKIADIFDFFNHNIWTFFIKCYYSFIIISTPIILCIFYLSESVIIFNILNILLFSFINIIIIFLLVIVFYSLYEIPLKKIFKSFLVSRHILYNNLEEEDNNYDYNLEEKRK
jgi:Fe-S cluster assembly iron-binding protein IscA